MDDAKSPRSSLRRFAGMCAALGHPFVDRVLVFSDAATLEAEWEDVRRGWQQRFATDRQSALDYAEAYRKAREELDAGTDPRTVARAGEPLPSAPPAFSAAPAAPVVPIVTKPSRGFDNPWAAGRAQPPVRIEMMPAPVVVSPVMALAPSGLDSTGEVRAIDEPAVPFAGRAQAPPPTLSPSPRQSGRTAPMAVVDLSKPPPVVAPASIESDVTPLATPALGDDDHGLPFIAGAARPPESAALAPHDELGATVTVEALAVADPMPFGRHGPSALDRRFTSAPLTLRQLAAIHVELELAPANHASVLGHYHLTSDSKSRIDRELVVWLGRDDSLRGAWDEALLQYRAWRASHGRR
jgi:hypothetical protein